MSVHDGYHPCTLRQARDFVVECMEANLVPMLKSSPGMGKSAMLSNVAKDFNLHLVDHRLSTSIPVDLNGMPTILDRDGPNPKATFLIFEDLFPTEDTPIPDGKDGFLLFLDEFNSAPKSVQAACYKIILDKKIGQKKLHPQLRIVLAGNLATDGAIVTELGTAMRSRVIHLRIKSNIDNFMEDVALPQKWDNRVVSYLNWKGEGHLNDFDPDHSGDTFCCERTWDFLQRLITDKPVTLAKMPLYAGTITAGKAMDFVQFCKVYESLPRIEQIVNDPTNTPLPHDDATRWATIGMLTEKATKDNLADLETYVDRFTKRFQILFFRGVIARHPNLRGHPIYVKFMAKLSRYLNDTSGQQQAA